MSAHMTPEQFRRHGYQVIDWIADYYGRVESLPVLSQVQPGEILAQLPLSPPAHGTGFDGVLA
ncbi:MAG TPA: aspartate aminotransferase family protein, partial [Mycobacterium sp.]|nr:aspartate aminotransferase family protein [Mycobacterium sp.]